MVTQKTGWYNDASEILSAEFIQTVVEGIARRKYKMKQVFMESSKKAEVISYYQATTRNLGTNALLRNSTVRGIPRGAAFPNSKREMQRLNSWMEKHGMEQTFFWEDIDSNNVDVVKEGMLDLISTVSRSVDFMLYNAIDDATNAQTLAAQGTWDNSTLASRRPHEDLLRSAALITSGENTAYEADTALISPGDAAYVFSNDTVLDAYTPTSSSLISNGVIGKLASLSKLIVSSVVEADEAVVLQSKRIGSYVSSFPLQTNRSEDWGNTITIRALERATSFITNPAAICVITNTRS